MYANMKMLLGIYMGSLKKPLDYRESKGSFTRGRETVMTKWASVMLRFVLVPMQSEA